LLFLLIFLGIMYLGSPLVIWLTQRQAANPQLQFYGRELQDPSYQFLTATAVQLQSIGFELIGYFGWVGQTTNADAFNAYLVHRRNGDTGIALMVKTPVGVRARTVIFSTRFVDQTSITTGNSNTPSVFVRPRNKPLYRFPWIHDPVRLYQVHQQLILRNKPGMVKDVPQPGSEAERLVDGLRQEMQDQVGPKILRLDSTGNAYRPTLLGAYRMTWKLLFPVKQITAIAKHFKAKRLEQSLGANVGAQPIHPGM
jgi:hypothetical protein